MIKYSLKTQAAYLLFGRTITFAMAAISPMILVRMLTMSDFGIYRQIIFVENVALALVVLRLPQNLYYFFPRTERHHRELLSQALSMLSFVSATGALIFYILAKLFDFLPTGVTSVYVLPLALYICTESVSSLLDHIFVLEKKPMVLPILSGGSQIARLGLIISAILIWRSVLAVVYALLLYSTIRLIFLLWYLIKQYAIRFGISDKKLFNAQLAYGLPLAGATIVALIGNQFEKGVINALTSPEDFAMYSVGSLGVMYAIMLVYTSMGDVAVPRFGELAMAGDFVGIKKLWHKIVSINTLLTVPLLVFGWVFAEEIISILFTEKYVASANIWRINLFNLVIQMLAYGYIPTALGKTKSILLGNSLRAAVVVPVSLILVPSIGIIGGAIAFLIGFWLNGLIQLFAGQRAIHLSLKEFLPWKRIGIIIIVSIAPVFPVSFISYCELSKLPSLLIAGVSYFTVVILMFQQIGYLDFGEIKKLLRR